MVHRSARRPYAYASERVGGLLWCTARPTVRIGMPKFPAGLQDPRYPFEEPPESCDFLGANVVTRAVWANGEAGIGMDFDLRLTHGWYAPARIELEVPHALNRVPAVVHAVVRDQDVLSQPHNLISTRNERGGTSVRLGVAHCEGTCTGWEDPDIGSLDGMHERSACPRPRPFACAGACAHSLTRIPHPVLCSRALAACWQSTWGAPTRATR